MCKTLFHLASCVLVLGVAFAGPAKAADPNLVGWWPLNEGAGDVALDLSDSGFNGTILNPTGGLGVDGSVWVEDAERGMVLSFNGVNGTGACVTTGMTIPAMDLTTDFTWMFWCKQDASQGFTADTGGNDVILGNRYGGTGSPLQFVKFTPTNFEFYNNDNTNFVTYPEVMPSSVWVHNVTVKDGDKLTYYRDGFEVRSITVTKIMDPNPFYMGADGFNGVQEAWCGCLSDVRLYNKAATQLEILAAAMNVERIDMEVGCAGKVPVIDGEVDYVWGSASTQYFVPVDANNASGSWKALYDSENLYVIVDVTDDSLVNDSNSSWQDDSVEFYFDGGNSKLNTALSGDDRQYTFGWGTDEIQGTNIQLEGVEQAQVVTESGWRIEIKFPWVALQEAAPQALDLIGVDCFYNDDDDGGDTREGAICTFADNADGNAWNDASRWGTAILAVPPEPVDPGADGLVAYYAFENDVNDSSGNGFNGTIVGDLTFGEGPAGYGAAMIFANEAYVDCGSDPNLDITGPISLSLWIRPDAEDPEGKGTETAPLAKATSTANPSWSWQVRYGWNSPLPYMAFTFNTSPRAWVYVGQKLTQGEWAHIACSADGQTLKCYLDGQETDSTAMGAITSSPTSLLIGSDGWGDDWIGGIDEVAVYNRALSAGEILYLAGARAADAVVPELPNDGE